jgi:hypothetical protein
VVKLLLLVLRVLQLLVVESKGIVEDVTEYHRRNNQHSKQGSNQQG